MTGGARARASLDALGVALVKAGTTAIVLFAGFRALSDDDFARVVIAERFAEQPALDPSGTSWLPFPFWLYGSAIALFGGGLDTARVLAGLLGVASALGVWWAGRALGLGRAGAFAGAALAAIFPYSALLGAATVPEAPSSALIVLGAAQLALADPKRRAFGAGCLLFATASRYEAWPAALVFALITLADAVRGKAARLLPAAAIALAFPLAWLAHGMLRHGDAAFFVARVTGYRSALGEPAPGLGAILRAPLALVTAEPELAAIAAVLGLTLLLSKRASALSGFGRFAAVLGAIVVFLMLGDARGSAPTHHGERALLAVWFGLALLAGHAFEHVLRLGSRRIALVAAVAAAIATALATRSLPGREALALRDAEVDIGRRAARRGVRRLAIDAPDFGFFAVQAAYGRPSATVVLDDRDPRRPRAPDALRDSPRALAARLAAASVHWLAVPRDRAPLAATLGSVRDGNPEWVLLELP